MKKQNRSTRAPKKRTEEDCVSPATKPSEHSVVDGAPKVTAYAWGGDEVAADDPQAIAKKSFDPATSAGRLRTPGRGSYENRESPGGGPPAIGPDEPEKGAPQPESRTLTGPLNPPTPGLRGLRSPASSGRWSAR